MKGYFTLGAILIIGLFLRIYKLPETFFLEGDIARDWLVIFDAWQDKKPFLVGPLSSFAGIFNGAWYYYTMAPVVIISKMRPEAIAASAVVLGLAEIFLIYKVAEMIFSQSIARIISLLFSLSFWAIKISHSLWNPNFLPLFTLIILYLLIRATKEGSVGKIVYALAVAGFGLQFHLGFALVIPAIILATWKLRSRLNYNKTILAGFLIILLFFLPMVIFEVRHDFVMTKTFLSYQTSGGGASLEELVKNSILATPAVHLLSLVTNVKFPVWSVWIIIAVVFAWFFKLKIRAGGEAIFWIFLATTLLLFMLAPVTVHNYYLNTLFPLPFLLVGSILTRLKAVPFATVSAIFVMFFIFTLIQSDAWSQPDRNLAWQRLAAEAIAQDKPQDYQFNLVTFGEQPFHSAWEYRFLARNLGFKSLTADQYAKAEVLYLIAERPMEEPLAAKSFETAEFGPKKVDRVWQLENGWQVFKLVK